MRTLIAFLFAAFGATALGQPTECPLHGVWKSDAAKTLADIAATNAMSAQAMSGLSDDFYGHMTHEWTCTDLRAWFDRDKRPEPVPYRISELTTESVLVTFPNGSESDLRLVFEGDCYKVRFEKQKYYEYFCPSQLP
jgi:hypothetical protein